MRTLILFALTLLLTACQSLEPNYRVEDLTFDEGLLGRWKLEPDPQNKDSPEQIIRIEPREVPVQDGSAKRDGLLLASPISSAAAKEKKPRQTQRAYKVIVERSGEQKRELELSGYLVRAGERTFAGLQVSQEQLAESGLFPLVIPLHILGRVQREGDTLTWELSGSTVMAWVPIIEPLDHPAKDGPDIPPIEQLNRVCLTTGDIDRLVRIYAKYADDPKFWKDKPKVFHRIPNEKPSAP